jgi:hypothetical protein
MNNASEMCGTTSSESKYVLQKFQEKHTWCSIVTVLKGKTKVFKAAQQEGNYLLTPYQQQESPKIKQN